MRHWLSLCILFFLLFPPLSGRTQKRERIDHLKSQLLSAKYDSTEIRLLLELAMAYQGFQSDSAAAYTMQALKKSEASGFEKGRADALLHLGRLKRDQSIAVEALEHMFDALKIYRKINDAVQIANSLNDISIVYANSGDYKNSLVYFKQALDLFRRNGDEKGESYALNNIGIIFHEMNDLDSARHFYEQSLAIKLRNNDQYGISRGYANLGIIAKDLGDWTNAMHYLSKADSIYVRSDDKQAQARNKLTMAEVKQRENKLGEARTLALDGLRIAEAMRDLQAMLGSNRLLAEIDEIRGDYKSSLAHQKVFNELSDSLIQRSHDETLEGLKAKFNFEEKEREIELLKKDNELHEAREKNGKLVTYTLIGGILLLIAFSSLMYYAYRTVKAARDSLANRNKEIDQQRHDLDKLNREKDRFFSILSHDLRAPLTSLKGLSYLQIHHGDVLTVEESIDIRQKIDTSIDNMTELINNILDWSTTTSKKRHWSFEQFNVNELIEKNIALYLNIAETKEVKIVNRSRDFVYGYADYQAIDTVIRNLLSNSIKFSHRGGIITITATPEGNMVNVSVCDDGVGISPELQQTLFTSATTISQKGTNNEKGIGIGLALCKELMAENGGTITVKSEPGNGSEFTISFRQHGEKNAKDGIKSEDARSFVQDEA